MSDSLQILMPAHNEGKNIKNHLSKVNNILKKKIKFSFLICEDGSSDNTLEILKKLKKNSKSEFYLKNKNKVTRQQLCQASKLLMLIIY